ncbi:hypothetical protein AC579_9082 [Pseudocercospora musae]|uniref:C2H2-type domain-containing protein n=1 Tax=Pseudocercospora musae TaxID=113226 RepID=A0A139IF53_9PEZI|nr:hypothetical protein AC579_9082 [Pseudocercospora musae]
MDEVEKMAQTGDLILECLECGSPMYNVDKNRIWEHARKHFGVKTWPPPLTGDGAWSLQAIIDTTKTLGDYSHTTGCVEHLKTEMVDSMSFEWLAEQAEAERMSQGLCLTCVQTNVDGPAVCFNPAHFD